MVLYFGWINIQMTYSSAEESSDEELLAVVSSIREKIEREQGLQGNVSIRIINGVVFLRCDAFTNHWGIEAAAVVDLYKFIGEAAIGSYGLLYLMDDEDPGYDNKFRVFRLAKGVLKECEDNLLSPINPTLEE